MTDRTAKQDGTIFLYAGSYTKSETDETGAGIGIYRYDPEEGTAAYLRTVRRDIIAGSLYVDAAKGVLYAADERKENPDLGGKGGGRVFAFAIDPADGGLTELSRVSSFGTLPAFLAPGGDGRWLLTCNHSNANWCTRVGRDETGAFHMEILHSDCTAVLYPTEADGALGQPCDVVSFPAEDGVLPCLHSIAAAPDGRHAAACERNQGKVHFLEIDGQGGRLRQLSCLEFTPKTGYPADFSPRYAAFHPTLPLFYFNSEHIPRLTAVRYGAAGAEPVGTWDITPWLPGLEGVRYTQSDLCISSDGGFLYCLHRVINAVSVWALEDGAPVHRQSLKLSGNGPRGMRLSPDGRFLLIGCPGSKEILSLRVAADGTLRECSGARGQETPACIAFYVCPAQR